MSIMKHYRDIEDEIEERVLGKKVLGDYLTTKSFINRARKYHNQYMLADDDLLRMASNRIHLHESTQHGLPERLFRYIKKLTGRTSEERPLNVPGQELKALMSMAELEEESPIVFNHEYEVNPSFYKALFNIACKKHGTR